MAFRNPLLGFTNCWLATEDGKLVKKDLWIDEEKGVIVDAQKSFFDKRQRPQRTVDLKGNILSPGFLDIQINGAYGFDFSVYDGNSEKYVNGLEMVAERIVETGVTSLVPTIITQQKQLYPSILTLLQPRSKVGSATLLGWHAEGPFLQMAKRGAHEPSFILSAPDGVQSFEHVYGADAISNSSLSLLDPSQHGVRIITVAPEIPEVLSSIRTLTDRGITISIGHSIASSQVASEAVRNGARLITHLFNAMPVLHHRDPGIIGLLGASPVTSAGREVGTGGFGSIVGSPLPSSKKEATSANSARVIQQLSEALAELPTPPRSPILKPKKSFPEEDDVEDEDWNGFSRPFYEIIVDGVHSHPNSVRLAYMAHKEGCILITDAMMIMDPHLKDGTYEWRDGRKIVKEGVKLYLEGSDTLAGSVVSMDICVRNFAKFTGCGLANAIKCATYNPARCLQIENQKGTLRPGADADFAILDHEGNVISTWVGGKEVWNVL